MKPTLPDLETLALQAGEILRQGYGKRHEIGSKGVIDVVTEVDHQSEEFLVGEIRRRFPEHRILTEESGELPGQDACTWYIDPLDGTVNYSHGISLFGVSIAFGCNGQVELGVVYAPILKECFTAQRGGGAWLNGQPIHVSQIDDMDRALLVTGFPYDVRTNPNNNLDHFVRLSMHSQAVRRLGSAALDLCYVAAGRFEGFWEIRLNAWDVAAGGLIAGEAGAKVTAMDGKPDFIAPPQSILAANPAIYPHLLRLLNPAS